MGSALPFQEPFRSPGHKQIRASSPKPPHRCDLAGEHRRADLIRGVAKPIGRDTFGAYARRWVDGYGGRSGTRLYIQRAIDAMESHIGHLRVAEIRPTDLAAAYRGLENGTRQAPSTKRRRRGLATSTVSRYANWVNTIFLAAQQGDVGVGVVVAGEATAGVLPDSLPGAGRVDGCQDLETPSQPALRRIGRDRPGPTIARGARTGAFLLVVMYGPRRHRRRAGTDVGG